MNTTNQTNRDLREFQLVRLFSEEGFAVIENLYARKGLLPPLQDLLNQAESQLEEILKPRPSVQPIVRRRARQTASKTYENVLDGAQSLPTPPYEPDPVPGPDVERVCQTICRPAFEPVPSPGVANEPQQLVSDTELGRQAPILPKLCEDLEGIADFAPSSPHPSLPSLPGPLPTPSSPHPSLPSSPGPLPTKRKQKPKLKRERRKGTARKSTTTSPTRIKECSVSLVDLRMSLPLLTNRLLEEYFPSKPQQEQTECKARTKSRTESVDSGNATDEGERVVPPLKISVCSPKRKSPQVSGSPLEAGGCSTIPPSVSPVKRGRLTKTQGVTSGHGPLNPGPLSGGDSSCLIVRGSSGLKTPIKGILKHHTRIRSENLVNRFLSATTAEKGARTVSVPKDVICTAEFNCKSQKVVRLNVFTPTSHQGTVDLKEISPFPTVCIQCNATFSTDKELSVHALASNHSSVFSY